MSTHKRRSRPETRLLAVLLATTLTLPAPAAAATPAPNACNHFDEYVNGR